MGKVSKDHEALVLWSLQKGDKSRHQETFKTNQVGSLMVFRVAETDKD